MEELCLLGVDFLFHSAACIDFGRMMMKVRGEEVPLLPLGAAEKVEGPVAGPVVTVEGLGLRCRTSKEGENRNVTTSAQAHEWPEWSARGADEVERALPTLLVDLEVPLS